MMVYQETFVQRIQHRIYVREYPGEEPTIVLMHGFPDNLHLYDRLIPYLSPPRRVIAFDFLGWGASDKPPGYPYTAANQVGDLDAVITQLRLQQVILVAHDASGPPAIDWALDRVQARSGAGVVEYLLLRHADAPAARGHLAVLDTRGQKYRTAGVADVWSVGLPSHVSVAGWEVFQRRGGQRSILATAVSTVRRHAKRSSCLLSLERRLIAHNTLTHKNAPEASRVQTAGPDHLWRRRSVPEYRRRPALP